MRRAEKTVFYDSADGRMVAEFFHGRVFLHLELRQWGMESAKKLRALWPAIKAALRSIGYVTIYAYNHEADARWPRFMSWFGFTELRIRNGWRLMECANA